jgi:uncharacterized protein YkwD
MRTENAVTSRRTHLTGFRRPVKAGLCLAMTALLAACVSTSVPATGVSGSATDHLAEIRASAGLPPLAADGKLERAASVQAGYMSGSGQMRHTTGWGKDFRARMKKAGVKGAAAENIAEGNMDLDRLFSMWMDSSGHRRNMLDPRFSRFGLASAPGADGQRYWALVLAK